MRFIIPMIFMAAISGTFMHTQAADTSAGQVASVAAHSLVVNEIIVPRVTATAYGVFDIETGEILLSHNADQSLPIASVTKLFTAAAALQSEKLDETVVVSVEDVAAEGRSGKLVAGQSYKLRELLFPLLLESSNDAAETFERTLGKAPFAGKVFSDNSGLSSQNKASVKELAHEVRNVYLNEPYIFDVTTLKQYVGEYTGWVNNSPVRDLPGYKGGKHGYTEAANRTLAAIFSEPSLGERELGYIILGSDDLRNDLIALRQVVEESVQME